VEELRARLHLAEGDRLDVQTIETPLIDISSRDLRRRVAAGRSLRYFLPRAVECYILDKKLYAAADETTPPRSGHHCSYNDG
jgi:nicotinate-nucleotide adenylyltransferase